MRDDVNGGKRDHDHGRRATDGAGGGERLLAEVEAYWRGLSRDEALPERRAVDPSRIDSALSSCFVLERVAPGIGRIRVAGPRIAIGAAHFLSLRTSVRWITSGRVLAPVVLQVARHAVLIQNAKQQP